MATCKRKKAFEIAKRDSNLGYRTNPEDTYNLRTLLRFLLRLQRCEDWRFPLIGLGELDRLGGDRLRTRWRLRGLGSLLMALAL